MQPSQNTQNVQSMKPIELLAERLPMSKMDDLKQIHEAGQKKDFQRQSDLLDDMRKSISSDLFEPKVSISQKDSLRTCIKAIDLMRSENEMKKAGSLNTPDLKIATDQSIIPPTIASALSEVRTRSLHISSDMANKTMSYLAKVEACAKHGAFEQIGVYGDALIKELRESHTNSYQAQLGPLAAKVKEVNVAANEFHQKISSGMKASVQPEPTGEVILPPPLPNHRPSLANSQLMQSLKQEAEPQKKNSFGLGFN